MRMAARVTSLCVCCVVVANTAIAARRIESRSEADYVVIGEVMRIYASESKVFNNYIVEVRVEEVEKGKDIKPYDTFRASCYLKNPGQPTPFMDSGGHKAVPKVGDRVKMFVMKARGNFEGTWPDWFDVLPPKEKGKEKEKASQSAREPKLGK